MMKTLGFKTYRFSLSWPRLLPDGTTDNVNQKGVDFYMNVIDALIAADIEPLITLYHWDLPSALNDNTANGGWLNYNITYLFADYAEFCFKTYGSKVKKWITINEPQSISWIGYGAGVMAPGRCSDYMNPKCNETGGGGDTPTEPYIVAHHLIIAHARAV
jgi:beta-glucosidase